MRLKTGKIVKSEIFESLNQHIIVKSWTEALISSMSLGKFLRKQGRESVGEEATTTDFSLPILPFHKQKKSECAFDTRLLMILRLIIGISLWMKWFSKTPKFLKPFSFLFYILYQTMKNLSFFNLYTFQEMSLK